MEKVTYKNRYSDVFTFTPTEDGNILMEGKFEWMRYGFPNVYTESYEAYCIDTDDDQVMTLGEFKVAVHDYDKETFKSTPLAEKYALLIYSNKDVIDMIDPSGGPYLAAGQDMGGFSRSFNKMIIEEFKSVPEGYLIIIKK